MSFRSQRLPIMNIVSQKRFCRGFIWAVFSSLMPFHTNVYRPLSSAHAFFTSGTLTTRSLSSESSSLDGGNLVRERFRNVRHLSGTKGLFTTKSRWFSTNSPTTTLAYGENMDQNDMMESDKLILVDENDNIVDIKDPKLCSKRAGHTFDEQTPRGVLHRAFSFFCFSPYRFCNQ